MIQRFYTGFGMTKLITSKDEYKEHLITALNVIYVGANLIWVYNVIQFSRKWQQKREKSRNYLILAWVSLCHIQDKQIYT